ncbi:uncharacterized protein LOC143301247 [Babylonia areolata]|uniref:uncharacterized protein LOC143301247 n=1 Tax=Babylonia areolata TaxID=304850 RepID=UPI003FD16A86
MTTLHVALTKVTGLWLLLPLLVDWRRLAAAENDSSSEECVAGEEGADCICDEGLCKWRSKTWEARKKLSFAKFHHGVLQSPLICSTESSVHCLSFDYQFNHHYSDIVTLTVGLDVEGRGNVSVWQLKGNTGGIYVAKAPVQTTADFRILFQVDKPQHHKPVADSYVIVTNIVYEETKCTIDPSDAVVQTHVTSPTVAKTSSPSPSPPTSSLSENDSCTGIIIGAVVAVVVIVAVGVFLVVAKRKKMFWFRPKDSSSQPVAMVSLSQRDVVTAPDPASVEGGSANSPASIQPATDHCSVVTPPPAIGAAAISQSETAGRGNDAPPEGGRHRAAETGRRGTSPTRPAGTGGIQPGSEDDGEYHVVDLVGQRHGPEGARVAGPREGQHIPDDGHYHLPWVDHAPPGAVPEAGSSYMAARGGAEDEYSRLGLAGKKTALAGEKESGGCRLYDHVGGGERDVYSHVQRDREPPVILDQVYSHIH